MLDTSLISSPEQQYVLKHIPEDFVVTERASFSFTEKGGRYPVFLLRKTNMTTMRAITVLASFLSLPRKAIQFCGTKDKHAVTSQYVSIKDVDVQRVLSLDFSLQLADGQSMSVSYCGHLSRPLALGLHDGNGFELTVRRVSQEGLACFDELETEKLATGASISFVNYFGAQRFGDKNVQIGRLLLQENYADAVAILKEEMPKVAAYIAQSPTDFVGALNCVAPRILKLYVHAYQSDIWNSCAQRFDCEHIPLVGFASTFASKELEDYALSLLAQDALTLRSFIFRSFPALASEGAVRDRVVTVSDFSFTILDDDLFDGYKKVLLSFSLQTSSYATVFVHELFKQSFFTK